MLVGLPVADHEKLALVEVVELGGVLVSVTVGAPDGGGGGGGCVLVIVHE